MENKKEKVLKFVENNRTKIIVVGTVLVSAGLCGAIGYSIGFDHGREYAVNSCNEILEACIGPNKIELSVF